MYKGNEYYKAREAQDKLGITKAKFYKWVREGLIPKIVIPGMKQGVYPKRDIDALLLSMSVSSSRLVFSKSSPADHIVEMMIDSKIFRHNFIFPLADRIAFQQKNEFTFHSLKVLDEVVGYISMFRFTDAVLTTILTGQRIERDIKVKEVLPFERFEPFSIFISLVAINPSLTQHRIRFFAGTLIFHFIHLLANLLANDYQITTLYTVTTTEESQRLAEHLGFHIISDKSVVANRLVYEYPLDQPHIQQLYELRNIYSKGLNL